MKEDRTAHKSWNVAIWKADAVAAEFQRSSKVHKRVPRVPTNKDNPEINCVADRSVRPAATVAAKAPKVSLAINAPCSLTLLVLVSERRMRSLNAGKIRRAVGNSYLAASSSGVIKKSRVARITEKHGLESTARRPMRVEALGLYLIAKIPANSPLIEI